MTECLVYIWCGSIERNQLIGMEGVLLFGTERAKAEGQGRGTCVSPHLSSTLLHTRGPKDKASTYSHVDGWSDVCLADRRRGLRPQPSFVTALCPQLELGGSYLQEQGGEDFKICAGMMYCWARRLVKLLLHSFKSQQSFEQ